jgi:hypothetical protein
MMKRFLAAAAAVVILGAGIATAALIGDTQVDPSRTHTFTEAAKTYTVAGTQQVVTVPAQTYVVPERSVTIAAGTTTQPTTTAPPGEIIRVGQSWTCNTSVNLSLVKITNPPGGAGALILGTGCTGNIARIEITGVVNTDAIKVQNSSTNAAHDLTIGGGYALCSGPATDGTHQDGMQGMGGRNITFRNLAIDCYGGGGGNFYPGRGGGGATMPTALICDHCAIGPRHRTGVAISTSVGSGVQNSLLCKPERFGTSGQSRAIIIDGTAQSPVNVNNTLANVGDPRCTVDGLIAWANG